jgi:hypothetical protein
MRELIYCLLSGVSLSPRRIDGEGRMPMRSVTDQLAFLSIRFGSEQASSSLTVFCPAITWMNYDLLKVWADNRFGPVADR